MIFVDMMSPVGHVRINSFYLNSLWQEGDVLMIGRQLSKKFDGFNKVIIKDNSSSKFNRIFIAFQVICQLICKPGHKVCFLSYDLALMPIVMLILRVVNCQVFAFEHNTVPETNLKKVFQRASGKDLLHITYAKHISLVFDGLGLSSCVVDHPALTPERASTWPEVRYIESIKVKFDKVIYSPSGSVLWDDIQQMATKHPEHLFVFKGEPLTDETNIVSFRLIEGYLEMLLLCDAVYIPFDWRTKVSGPFYEAMALGKVVVLKDNEFGRFCKSRFPNNVEYCVAKINSNVMSKVDVLDYNNQVVSNLIKIFDVLVK
ncbi:hypothetical protein FQ186_05155 [Pseudomonas sp. ANT_H14]|uniref:hypothetical protein n=1 Tax=unclassified Pseudomonas TaxID=196821 RepID=UPI0011ED738A|nr:MULTISPECIES: hypothetical protein [unclassified Pseudomonas]KAA0947508.1 hypothetical protein FQ182_10670 [Pseudomonas sp. ANT_H4]KAA0953926.1 hypothetical protein FQ186_05155 [Pseudomonas sp. ANT_H14]